MSFTYLLLNIFIIAIPLGLTFDTRMSRVQPARGGIVIDGAYYSR